MTEKEYNLALEYITKKSEQDKDAKITNEMKLSFYGYFKQITVGPCNVPAPSRLKVVEKAKWDAWSKLKNMKKEDAMKGYIQMVNKVNPKWRTFVPSKL